MGKRYKIQAITDKNRQSENGGCLAGNRRIFRFGAIFCVITVLYYVVALLPWVDGGLFPAYLRLNAQASSAILNRLGQSSHSENMSVRSPRFSMTIKRGCDALEPSWLFCAAVLAFPSSWRRKFIGILAGVSLIFALNLVRIVSLYFIGVHTPALFETVHLEVWPVLFILAALGAWLFWIRGLQHQPTVISPSQA